MDDLNKLILKAQQGDKDAYGRIYNIYYKKIYRYCLYNTGHKERSEDLCQETFIKAWRSLPNFKINHEGTLQAYLFRIAKNLIIDQSRKKKELGLEEIAEAQSNEDLEENLGREEEIKRVRTALDKLDDLDKQIVILRFFEELSFEEVAKVTGQNEGALRVRVHRTLKKLKAILGDK